MVSAILAVGSSSAEPLNVGDQAPAFEAKDSEGKTVRSTDVYGKSTVVIYFYPKDDTPGCTKEACGIRDDYGEFQKLGIPVYGVSFDSVESHQKFKTKYNLPFVLLADTGKQIAKAFGVADDKTRFAPRMTFIVGTDGKIAYVNRKVTPATHSTEIRAELATLAPKQ